MTGTERLEKIGLTRAANVVKTLRLRHRKLTLAYEHFRFVRQERIDAFNYRLREATLKETKYASSYCALVFTPLEDYAHVPPAHVLDALELAHAKECFDRFEVASIQSVKVVKDPIVFGRVDGCTDRFFIAQWDDDVRIEDLLSPTEG